MKTELALLLTDVVDSTALAETMGPTATAELWTAHDRCARDLLAAWRGREIDKTDGMLMIFDAAADAVEFAIAYHRALASLDPPLAARAGLHVGTVVLRENCAADIARGAKPLEVDGAPKAIAARIMAIANGGQTLMTADAHAALADRSAPPYRVESHGHWRLKGIAEPVELFEVGEANAAFIPPDDGPKAYRVVRRDDAWFPVRNIRTNLPSERDAFVGRRESLDEIARRFDSGTRLVSVFGIGGTGKTRLATRFGWTWLGDYPGGVWFCDLSQARGVDGIAFAVAQALGVPLGKDDPLTQLGHAIAGHGRCLVILDNFEQVVRHADETVSQWLNRAPDARFIVTTREVLGLKGEQVMALSPLHTEDAVTLFLRRAESAQPDYCPRGEDTSSIARLVNLLDGLPLAIELAAARVRVMAPKTLLARMSERFKLLSSVGARQDRQATLRAVLDWSWDLLAMPERDALAQLSVFEGGFTLESVEAVIDLSAHDDAPLAMDALQSLVQKSLVRPVGQGGMRFDLLVSVKEYAAEHLRSVGRYPGSGPSARLAAEIRHGGYFAAADRSLATAEDSVELDNFIVACRRAATRGDAGVAAAALDRAWAGLRMRGPFRVGIELAAAVRATPGLDDADAALAEWVEAAALNESGKDAEAYVHYERSLASARRAGHRPRESRALEGMAFAALLGGRLDDALAHATQALAIASEIGDRQLEARALARIGCFYHFEGSLQEAVDRYQSALAIAREAEDGDLEGSILGNLAVAFGLLGMGDEARIQMEAGIDAARRTGNRRLEGNARGNLGMLHQVQGRFDMAHDSGSAALAIAREMGNVRLECVALCNVGAACESLGRLDEAREHYAGAVDIAHELGDRRQEGQFLGYLGRLHGRQREFDAARECFRTGESLLREASDWFSVAILQAARAETECLAGDVDTARKALGEAERIARETGSAVQSELDLAIARARAAVEVTPLPSAEGG